MLFCRMFVYVAVICPLECLTEELRCFLSRKSNLGKCHPFLFPEQLLKKVICVRHWGLIGQNN